MKINLYEWVLIERRAPIIIGMGEGVLGLLFTVVASLAPSLRLPQWLPPDLLSDLGVGLLAAGITTATLEPISRRRLQRDVEEIKQAHFESVLKGLMPEPIFDEVQAHIIRQPFLRTNFHVTLELSWTDETREYLCKSQTNSYDVENMSRTLERYELRVSEERVNEDKFPGSTRIQEIRVQLPVDPMPTVYIDARLDEFVEKTDQYVRALIPVMLEPGQSAKVITRRKTILSGRDVYPYAVNKPTIQLDLTVAHPEDLAVQAMPMHPSQHAFVNEVNALTLKRWCIEAGLLPFQGIEISWHPLSGLKER